MNSPNGKQILPGKVTYTGVTTLKSGELILSGTSPIGDLKLMGGTLGFLSDTLQVKDLMGSSGGFVFDFRKNKTISVSGQMNVSVIPEALDVFTFKNITPRKTRHMQYFLLRIKKMHFQHLWTRNSNIQMPQQIKSIMPCLEQVTLR